MTTNGAMKGVWVDGNALWNMLTRILHVNPINFEKLYDFLVNQTGCARVCFRPPTYILNPGVAGLQKMCEASGFHARIIASDGGADDRAILDEISLVTPSEVSEIVVVAHDGDYIKCLREKAAQGIRVIVVATKNIDSDTGRMAISSGLLDPRFEFVELAEVCEQLGPRQIMPVICNHGESEAHILRVTFKFSDPSVLRPLMGAIADISIRHPRVTSIRTEQIRAAIE